MLSFMGDSTGCLLGVHAIVMGSYMPPEKTAKLVIIRGGYRRQAGQDWEFQGLRLGFRFWSALLSTWGFQI